MICVEIPGQAGDDVILSARQYVLFVFLDHCYDVVSYRYAVAYAELIVNSVPWECLAFLDKLEYLECVSCNLMLADELSWLKEGLDHTFLG